MSFAATTTTAAFAAVGKARLVAVLGVSESRFEKCANPMRRDRLNRPQMVAADTLSACMGASTPHLDAMGAQLAAKACGSPAAGRWRGSPRRWRERRNWTRRYEKRSAVSGQQSAGS